MRLTFSGNIGQQLRDLVEAEAGQISDALRQAVMETSLGLQRELRGQVERAGLGAGLANSWDRAVFPPTRKRTWRPASLVWSKATVLHDAFTEGPVILPRRGAFLVIPTPAAEALGATTTTLNRKGGPVPAGGGRRLSNLDAAAERLRVPIVSAKPSNGGSRRGTGRAEDRGFILLVPARRSRSNLVALYFRARDAKPVHLFTLVRSTRVPKLLDLPGALDRAEADFAARTAAALAEG